MLEAMNNATTEKYKDMTVMANNLALFMEDLQKKCACPF